MGRAIFFCPMKKMTSMSLATTHFGRRPLAHAQIASRAVANARAPAAKAHKWTVFRALCAARERL